MSDDVLIRVDGVSKKFCRSLKRSLWYGVKDTAADLIGRPSLDSLRHAEFWAVDGVSFELKRGECLGLIGHNGAGKTTLLKMLNGLIKPDAGRIEMRGRITALIALGAGFNPILTGRENIYVNASVLGLSKRETDAKVDEIVEFAEIDEFIDSPVRIYSSGMVVRLGFSIATALEPDVLLLDEVLAVGDGEFRARCARRLGTLLENAAVILVSHNTLYIKRLCDKALLLQNGKEVDRGEPDKVLANYVSSNDDLPNGRSFSILGDNVLDAQVVSVSEKTRHGGRLTLRVHINLSRPMRCDQAYINIHDHARDIQAQVILDELVGTLDQGINELDISIEPLFLCRGRFLGTVRLWTAGGKKTLATLSKSFSFENEGPVSLLGASYYPPGRASVSRRAAPLAKPTKIAAETL